MERSRPNRNLNPSEIEDSEVENETHFNNEKNVAYISNIPTFQNHFIEISFDDDIDDDKTIVTNNINEDKRTVETLSTKSDGSFVMSLITEKLNNPSESKGLESNPGKFTSIMMNGEFVVADEACNMNDYRRNVSTYVVLSAGAFLVAGIIFFTLHALHVDLPL